MTAIFFKLSTLLALALYIQTNVAASPFENSVPGSTKRWNSQYGCCETVKSDGSVYSCDYAITQSDCK